MPCNNVARLCTHIKWQLHTAAIPSVIGMCGSVPATLCTCYDSFMAPSADRFRSIPSYKIFMYTLVHKMCSIVAETFAVFRRQIECSTRKNEGGECYTGACELLQVFHGEYEYARQPPQKRTEKQTQEIANKVVTVVFSRCFLQYDWMLCEQIKCIKV